MLHQATSAIKKNCLRAPNLIANSRNMYFVGKFVNKWSNLFKFSPETYSSTVTTRRVQRCVTRRGTAWVNTSLANMGHRRFPAMQKDGKWREGSCIGEQGTNDEATVRDPNLQSRRHRRRGLSQEEVATGSQFVPFVPISLVSRLRDTIAKCTQGRRAGRPRFKRCNLLSILYLSRGFTRTFDARRALFVTKYCSVRSRLFLTDYLEDIKLTTGPIY